MFPQLFSYGSFVLPTYGLLVASGFAVGLVMALRLARQEGLDKAAIYNLGVYVALAALLGAKLLLIFQDMDYYRQNPGTIFSFSTIQSGGIFYGGLIGGIGMALWYGRRVQLPFLRTADAFAPGIALGHFFGRLGCFSAGCCWGEPTTLPWGVTFSNPYSHQTVGVPLDIALHPTQLYEAAAELAIFAFLYRLYRQKRFHGQILGWYLLLYPAARFIIEFVRSHSEAAYFGGQLFSLTQWAGLLLVGFAAWLLWFSSSSRQRLEPVSASHGHTVSQSRRAAKFSGD